MGILSYNANVKNAFGAMIIGLILFVLSFFVLWLNEKSNANQIKIADYMSKNAIEVTSPERENDNKLISVSGNAKTDETLSDGIISLKNTLVLDRNVEMYQWEENSDDENSQSTNYIYKKQWSDDEINSDNFHKSGYVNPPFTVKSIRYNAKSGSFGEFKLTKTQTEKIGNLNSYTNLPANSKYKIEDGMYYYKGHDYTNPQIGDIRISYSYAPSGTGISLIGTQKTDNSVEPMISKFGQIYVQYDGILTKNEIIEKFRQQNSLKTWLLRLLGFILMFFGLKLITNPIVTISAFIPLLAELVNFATTSIVLIVALILSSVTIGIAWFAYRLFWALLLFGISAILFKLIFDIKNK